MRILVWLLAATAFAQDYDILIRGGRVVDGTGNPWFSADVAVKGHRIAAIGRIDPARARRVIDAAGMVVSPGFIDIHSHSDYTLVRDGNGESAVRQGITTVIVGEGPSAAPVGGRQVGRPNGETWTDFDGYFSTLLKQGISLNLGSFVGSSQVWLYVRGPRAGPPTPQERDAMREQVRIAMRQGALGVSTSLSGPPGAWIDTESLVAMCQPAGEAGGIYQTHIRTEGYGVFEAVTEALEIGRRAGLPVEIIHLKIAENALWGKMPDLIARIQAARAAGQQVQANVYPYRAGQNDLSAIIPPWAQEGGAQAMISRLSDAALRPRLESEILLGIKGSNWYNHFTATGSWEGMLLVSFSNPKYKRFEGRRMSDAIRDIGRPPVDVLFELLRENGGSVPTVYFHHTEEDMRYALRTPWVSVGSDGGALKTDGPLAAGNPHPRYYGTFPRVLGRYVRQEKLLTLEDAVRKMTSANAAKISQWDRGILRSGMWADVTVFDPARVIDRATYEKPHQYPEGIEYVVVNGQVVIDRGAHTGARPGTVLYGSGRQARQTANRARE